MLTFLTQKFIDDLSVLEIMNLVSIGLASYNCWNHVPSDIATDNFYLDAENVKSQGYLDIIQDSTDSRQMKLISTGVPAVPTFWTPVL